MKAKEWLIGAIPIVLLFLIFQGYNIGPFIFFMLVLGAIAYLLHRQGALSLSKTKRQGQEVKKSEIKFDSIGGLERTKQELKEALDFLVEDEQARQLGIRPLKGILLAGPPGTGKTMLAKAAATYADAAFVAASGSQFVEMYVGVGASRIRSLFQEARELAESKGSSYAIIFIDEIDAIGGQRHGQQHREYDQTLNQLLTEMDGISTTESPRLLLIAATNRVDMLDKALLRPGRFDRHITVDLPDKNARKHILKIHLADKPVSESLDWEGLARDTYGFSGAQLESVANEAAIYAFRQNEKEITMTHLAQAIDKVMLGEQTDRQASNEEKRRVAFHEMGHAICSEVLRPHSVSQVVLTPRGGALGYVRQTQPQERYLYTKAYLEEQIMIALAGAVAEEIYFGERSTGSKNDFDQALRGVEQMIECGLSRLGIISPDHISKAEMHNEINHIFDDLLKKTKILLREYDHVFEIGVSRLMSEERLSGAEFRQILQRYRQKKEIS